jgi:hypothetical protein
VVISKIAHSTEIHKTTAIPPGNAYAVPSCRLGGMNLPIGVFNLSLSYPGPLALAIPTQHRATKRLVTGHEFIRATRNALQPGFQPLRPATPTLLLRFSKSALCKNPLSDRQRRNGTECSACPSQPNFKTTSKSLASPILLRGRILGNRVAATRLQRPLRALSFEFAFDLVPTTQPAIAKAVSHAKASATAGGGGPIFLPMSSK